MALKRIEEYWSEFFGISVDKLKSRGIVVVPHKGLSNYNGAWIFKHNLSWIISVPGDMQEKISAKKIEVAEETIDLFKEEKLRGLFGKKIAKVIGPTFQVYYDQAITGEMSNQIVVLNEQEHQEQIEELSGSGDPKGWLHSVWPKSYNPLILS